MPESVGSVAHFRDISSADWFRVLVVFVVKKVVHSIDYEPRSQ
jgi:hypothetical protein